jgi:hypothetical protein
MNCILEFDFLACLYIYDLRMGEIKLFQLKNVL